METYNYISVPSVIWSVFLFTPQFFLFVMELKGISCKFQMD